MNDLIPPVPSSDTAYSVNVSEYFTHNMEMIARRSILCDPVALGSDPEAVTDSIIRDIAMIWDNMVAIF